MAKVCINGEYFEFDGSHKPMSEALAIEKVAGMRYVQWEQELQLGSARALAVFAWLIWRRNGRDVNFEDMLTDDDAEGHVEFRFGEFLNSLREAGTEKEPDPTEGPTASGPDGTPTTSKSTPPSSRSSSTSGRGKSTG